MLSFGLALGLRLFVGLQVLIENLEQPDDHVKDSRGPDETHIVLDLGV